MFLFDFGWKNRAIAITVPGLTHLRLRVLEIHDLILSKVKRFSPKDRNDIQHLVERPGVSHAVLVERYGSARLLLDYDEREEIDAHFNLIETDFLGLDATLFS